MLGPCRKRQPSGLVDGCGLFEASSNEKICEACGCHRSFHVASLDASLPSVASSSLSSPRPIHTHPPPITSPSKTSRGSPTPQPSTDTFTVSSSTNDIVPFQIQRPIPLRPVILPKSTPYDNQVYTSIPNLSDIKNDISQADSNVKVMSFPEYPDGAVDLDIIAHPLDDFGYTAWSMYHFTKWTSTVNQSTSRKLKCMGVMCCSHQDCGFVQRPAKKLLSHKSNATCSIHHTTLQYLECNATLIWKDYFALDHTSQPVLHHCMTHRGVHGHPKPPPIRPPPSLQYELKQKVLHAPGTRPKQLLTGSHFTESVREIHPSLSNLDRLGYMRRSV